MSDQQVDFDYLAEVVTRCAGVATTPSALAADPTFDELGVDSLGVLGIVAEVENHLRVSMPDGVEKLQRPSDLLDVVNQRLSGTR